ncbi:GNAT family N-acetyltransferase [Flavobacterium cerinum]|uniref:N-acetyltransferase n=1 Tax=Flavobacterium cerinum TaxID=2502784 RepID=A0ABY5IY80_9FLAO|nr:GNAT family N-acetyltransferase [Flavobacterium cerinum]UUC46683.1 N-acetyltransferase [Flavobacterium cerinum]
MEDHLKLVNNEEKSRFELEVESYIAFIDYKIKDKKIYLIHTEVPAELGGKGIGNAIVLKTLHYIKDNGYSLVPLCPFVAAYIKRHTEWNTLVAH